MSKYTYYILLRKVCQNIPNYTLLRKVFQNIPNYTLLRKVFQNIPFKKSISKYVPII